MAQEHASSRTFPVLQKSDAVLSVLRRKHLLRGSTVLSYCVLPPVHIGQDLVYSGITLITQPLELIQIYFFCACNVFWYNGKG